MFILFYQINAKLKKLNRLLQIVHLHMYLLKINIINGIFFMIMIIFRFHTNWYKMPVSIQKLILNIMLNCNKPYLFTFFSVYYPTIEGFASVFLLLFYS